ncbi:hypothetical protein ABH897_004687 [Paenibacillus sp. RC73]
MTDRAWLIKEVILSYKIIFKLCLRLSLALRDEFRKDILANNSFRVQVQKGYIIVSKRVNIND